MKIGYIFAGQGAQEVGMGRSFYNNFDSSKAIFDTANLALGYDLKAICFEGTQDQLNQTEITQPAILTTSIAILKALEAKLEIKPTAVAGLSLGEYSAHVCSGSLTFQDAIKLVQKRGALMQSAVPIGVGGMIALVGVDAATANQIAERASEFGIVEVCNYNSPKQIVLGGELVALEKAAEIAKENGAKRVIPLPVSAPFHTSMLAPAEEGLKSALKNIELHTMRIPVISNVDGRIVGSEDSIPEYLAKQVTSSVKWIDCIESMKAMGIDTLIEIGPGTALAGFVAKIDRSIKVLSVHNLETLEEAVSYIASTDAYQRAI